MMLHRFGTIENQRVQNAKNGEEMERTKYVKYFFVIDSKHRLIRLNNWAFIDVIVCKVVSNV